MVMVFLERIYAFHLCALQYNRSHKIQRRKHMNLSSGYNGKPTGRNDLRTVIDKKIWSKFPLSSLGRTQ